MKKNIFLIFMLLGSVVLNAQIIGIDIETDSHELSFNTGKDLLNYLNEKYKSAPCKAYTFSQKNKHYRNDSVVRTSEWHEAIEFPDKFRIDFGDKTSGNFVIFKNDSSYRYKQSKLVKTAYNPNTLLLLLGGMYYREQDDITRRLEKEHYNTTVISHQKWNKQKVYIIGAQPGDTTSNQIWVSKKNWRVIRIIEKMDDGHMMDMTFDEYQKHCNGYVETKVTFKSDGKIEQVEEYYDIKAVDNFPKETFNPVP